MQSATLSGKTNRPLGAKMSSEGNYTKIDIASDRSCLDDESREAKNLPLRTS
jgi:hypothetical protein